MKKILVLLSGVIFTTLALADNFTYIKGPALHTSASTQATAGGTTTLFNGSNTNQEFTGTTTQTVVLPSALTLNDDREFNIWNRSTGAVTVNDGAGNSLSVVAAGSQGLFHLIAGGSVAGTWDVPAVIASSSDHSITSCGAHNWAFGQSTAWALSCSQPNFSDLSGSLAPSQLPAFTGDVTIPAGSSVSTLATVNANVGTYPKVTVNAKGLITAATTLSSGDIPNNAANTSGTASNVTGTVAISNGGTGQTTQQAASDAIHGSTTSGYYARGNGSHVVMSPIQVSDVPALTTGQMPALTASSAIQKGNGSGLFTAAGYADIVNLFSACSGTQYLGADGSCHTVAAASPLTTKGDLYGFDTVNNRIPVGTNGQVLTADSTQTLGLKWAPAGTASPLTTKGDIYVYSTTNDRLPVGGVGHILVSDPTMAAGIRWDAPTAANNFISNPSGQSGLTIGLPTNWAVNLSSYTASPTGIVTNTSTCISSVSSTVGVYPGESIVATGVPVYTIVLGIGTGPCSAGQVQMSAAATSTQSSQTIYFASSFVIDSTSGNGIGGTSYDLQYFAAGSTDYARTGPITLNNDATGICTASLSYKTTSSVYTLNLYYNSTVLKTLALPASSTYTTASMNYPCASGYTLQVAATGAATSVINFGNVYWGLATNLGTSTPPTQTVLNSTGTTAGYLFTSSSANATVGATYTNNGNTYTVLATIAAQTLLFCSGASAPTASGTLTKASGTGDSTITFSAEQALAQYTAPSNVTYLKIRAQGPGGGGGGSGVGSGGTGGIGTITAFGVGPIIANGGAGGLPLSLGGTGGTASVGAGANKIVAYQGGYGQSAGSNSGSAIYLAGGNGGSSPFGGAGAGGQIGNGANGIANTGSGGGGGGVSVINYDSAGSGGGAGGYAEAQVNAPPTIIYYCIGSGGSGGTAGSSGGTGGNGGAGVIIIDEHYGN